MVISTDSFDAYMYIHAHLVLPNHIGCACEQREKDRLVSLSFFQGYHSTDVKKIKCILKS